MSNDTKNKAVAGPPIIAVVNDHQVEIGQSFITTTVCVASWARWIPGPSPQHRYHLYPGASQLGVNLIGCFIFFLSGYNVALMASVSSQQPYLRTIHLDDGSSHTQLLIGVVNSIYWVGVMGGALLVGWFSDRAGRRKAVVFSGLFGLVVIPLVASLQNFTWALVMRMINGFCTGAFDSVGLNWSAESVDARHRGRALGFQLCCATGGASISYFIVYGLQRDTTGDIIWRFALAFQLIFVLIVLSMVYFLPESPRWLAKVGLMDEARDVLTSLKNGSSTEELRMAVDADLEAITAAIQLEVEFDSASTYWQMFTSSDRFRTARRTWSALFIQFATQAMIGSGIVGAYGIKIFETGGWSSDTAALLSGVGIVTQGVFGIVGAIFSDWIGRRRAMIHGAVASTALLAFIGMCGYFVATNAGSNPALAKSYGTATVALVELWSALFGLTWLWCPFVYPSEIFPSRSRAKGSSIGIVGLASGSFLTNMISPYLFATIGYKSMFVFSGLSLVVCLACYLWMPETAKKTLEDIDHLYE